MTAINALEQANINAQQTTFTAAPQQAVYTPNLAMSPDTYTPSAQQQVELSPQAKTNMFTALALSLLGGTYFAKPKTKGADEMLHMDEKTFNEKTAKIKALPEDAVEARALKEFETLRANKSLIPAETIKGIYGEKDSLNIQELIKKINPKATTIDEAKITIENIKNNVGQINTTLEQLQLRKIEEGITAEHLQFFNENIPDNFKSFKEGFKKAFPKGTKCTPEALEAFLKPHETSINKMLTLKETALLLAENSAEIGTVTKQDAVKTAERIYADYVNNEAKTLFESFKNKLPKARLAGAAKWFALGLGVSILTDTILGFFTKKKEN